MKPYFIVILIVSLFYSCNGNEIKEKEYLSDSTNSSLDTLASNAEISEDTLSLDNNNTSISNPTSIVDFFILFKEKELVNQYGLENTSNGWKCFNIEDKEIVYTSIVDIKNGYLSIEDEGTGAGYRITEMALFKKADGKFIIALNTYYKEQSGFYMNILNSNLAFYNYSDGKINDITNSCFRNKLATTDFLKLTYAGEEELELYYSLPRIGTSIEGRYNKDFCEFCKSTEKYKKNMSTENYEKLSSKCLVCDQIIKDVMLITFNKQTGTFTLKRE